jgi:hypothetical protein
VNGSRINRTEKFECVRAKTIAIAPVKAKIISKIQMGFNAI